ncbi:hypothetical protein BDW59DRAFT_16348 [Aspergillus cavernicola]|uniref:Mid2 domain-containing protein n=1 Tax=Aspergillus cavernicola TaxID=176166 RepID=A0ABR4HIK5_9EURO
MVGCCPTTSASTSCMIFSTCYDDTEISATPQLLSSTTDPFVMFCTGEDSAYCHTWTWPDLNIADVACTDDSSSELETIYTAGSLTDNDDDEDQITETISVSWISDAVLLNLRSVSATTTSTTDTTSPGNTATGSVIPTSGTGDESEDGGSSTPVGTIVGAVVGGVLGLILVVLAGVLIWRYRKKTEEKAEQELLTGKPELASQEARIEAELHGGNGANRHELLAREARYELQ